MVINNEDNIEVVLENSRMQYVTLVEKFLF